MGKVSLVITDLGISHRRSKDNRTRNSRSRSCASNMIKPLPTWYCFLVRNNARALGSSFTLRTLPYSRLFPKRPLRIITYLPTNTGTMALVLNPYCIALSSAAANKEGGLRPREFRSKSIVLGFKRSSGLCMAK